MAAVHIMKMSLLHTEGIYFFIYIRKWTDASFQIVLRTRRLMHRKEAFSQSDSWQGHGIY